MAYWWLPCPVCGTEFSAHEWREQVDGLWGNEPGTGLCICPLCARWGLGEHHQHEVVELELDLEGFEEDMRQLQGDQQRLRSDCLRAIGHAAERSTLASARLSGRELPPGYQRSEKVERYLKELGRLRGVSWFEG